MELENAKKTATGRFFFGMESRHLLNANRLIQTLIDINQGACNAIPGPSIGVCQHQTKKTSATCGPQDFYKEYHDLSSQQTVKKMHKIPCDLANNTIGQETRIDNALQNRKVVKVYNNLQ